MSTVQFPIGKDYQSIKCEKGVWYLYYQGHRIRHLDYHESTLVNGAIKYATTKECVETS